MNRKRPRILFDVDGPLTAGFNDVFCSLLRERGIDATPDRITDWSIEDSFNVPHYTRAVVRSRLCERGVCSSFEPLPGARELLEELREWADVYAVTAPLSGSPTWAWERERWLFEHLGFDPHHVVSVNDKFVVSGAALVDDKAANVREWQAAHPAGLAILWREPQNASEKWDKCASTYDELREWLHALWVEPAEPLANLGGPWARRVLVG